MEVVLLVDVVGVGKAGARVKTKDGYALNYLIPKGLADRVGGAKAQGIVSVLKKRAVDTARTEQERRQKIGALDGTTITLRVRANGTRLYGGVHSADIAKALKIDAKYIQLPVPLKTVGTHHVRLSLGTALTADLVVVIEAE